MSQITISRTHQLPVNELKEKINAIILDIEDKLVFCSEWESEQFLRFRRKGANGSIEINHQCFELNLQLGIMFRMLKGVIHNEIIQVVDSHLKTE